ncbi:EAL domain-containing protein [Achromobacter denitrificans]
MLSLLFIATIVPATTVLALWSWQGHRFVAAIKEGGAASISAVLQNFGARMVENLSLLSATASGIVNQEDADASRCTAFLSQWIAGRPAYRSVAVLRPDGEPLCRIARNALEPLLFDGPPYARDGAAAAAQPGLLSWRGMGSTLAVSLPVDSPQGVPGWRVAAVLDTEPLLRRLIGYVSTRLDEWVLVGPDGQILAAQDEARYPLGGGFEKRAAHARGFVVQPITGMGDASLPFDFLSADPASKTGLGLSIAYKDVNIPALMEWRNIALYGILVVALLVIVGFFGWLWIYRNLRKNFVLLAEKIGCLKKGDFKSHESVSPTTREFGEITRDLNLLGDMLETYHKTADDRLGHLKDQVRILRLVAATRPLEESLTALCHFVEAQVAESYCSILLLGKSGKVVERSFAPRLSPSYRHALIGLQIGPTVISCGAAMARNAEVVVSDIATHPNWMNFRQMALSFGLRSCWSRPFGDSTRTVRGAFAIYGLRPRTPDRYESITLGMAAEIAAIAIELSDAQTALYHQATFDQLTSLLNRHAFFERLEKAMNGGRRADRRLAIFMIDLDRFKYLNDTYGHVAGDSIIREIGQRLARSARLGDAVARLGGDEFAVLLEGITDPQDAENVAQKLLRSMEQPMELNGSGQIYVTGSIGITLFPEDGQKIKQLLNNADQAMYRAKRNGGNQYAFYVDAMHSANRRKAKLSNDLRDALKNREFALVFQPMIALASKRVVMLEALLRWNHPQEGNISPVEFIPVLEEIGLIVPVSDWVFQEALKAYQEYCVPGEKNVKLAINVSPLQLQRDTAVVQNWIGQLHAVGLNGSQIMAEVTEDGVLEDSEFLAYNIAALKENGIFLALDDFGTGYSSLSRIQDLRPEILKIDKVFIRDIHQQEPARILCKAMIVMAHQLGMLVVAEGIELQEQYDALLEMGCDYGQGYFICRPAPMAALFPPCRPCDAEPLSAQERAMPAEESTMA